MGCCLGLHTPRLFPCAKRAHSPTVPQPLPAKFSVAGRLSFGVPSLEQRPECFDPDTPTQSFGPFRDITGARPPVAKHPKLRFVPPLDFLSLSTASSALQLAGLFHPAATCRIPLPVRGLFPLCQLVPLSRNALPPCRSSTNRSRASPLPPLMPRLRGLISGKRSVPKSRCYPSP